MSAVQTRTLILTASLLILARAGAGGEATAAAPPDDPVLAGLVADAIERGPDVAAARARLEAARERPAQARALPDASASLVFTNEGWRPGLGTMPDASLALMGSQALPWPGKLRLRGEAAEAEAAQVEQQLARARLSAAAAVRRGYYGLLEARALLAVTREQAALWEHIEGVARARYQVGQGVQQDVLRTQIEITRSQQLVAAQEAEARMRLAEVNRAAGRDVSAPVATAATLPPPFAGDTAGLVERALAVSPELAGARAEVARGAILVRLAGKEFKPDLGVQATYMNRGGLDPMWQAGVTVSLPTARARRRAAVAESDAAFRAAEANLRTIEQQVRLRTEQRLAQLEAGRHIATLYEQGVVPQDRMSVEAAIASYQAGRLPFVAVLEALTSLYQDRSALVRVLAGLARTRIALDEASLDVTSEMPGVAGGTGMGAAMAGPASPPLAPATAPASGGPSMGRPGM